MILFRFILTKNITVPAHEILESKNLMIFKISGSSYITVFEKTQVLKL